MQIVDIKKDIGLIRVSFIDGNGFTSYRLDNAPKGLNVGDKVSAFCKMNKKSGKVEAFIFKDRR